MEKLMDEYPAELLESFKEFLASRKNKQDHNIDVSPTKKITNQKTLDNWLIKTNKPMTKPEMGKISKVTCSPGESNSTENCPVNKNIIVGSSSKSQCSSETNKPMKKPEMVQISEVTCSTGESNNTENSPVKKNIIVGSSSKSQCSSETNKPMQKPDMVKISDVAGESNSTENSPVNKSVIVGSSSKSQCSSEISFEEIKPINSNNDRTIVANSSKSLFSNETSLEKRYQPYVLCEKLNLNEINLESLPKSGLNGSVESKLTSITGNSPSIVTEVKKSKVIEKNMESRKNNDNKSKNENNLKAKTDIPISSESDGGSECAVTSNSPNKLGRQLRSRKQSNEILADSVCEKVHSSVSNSSKPLDSKMSNSDDGNEYHTLEKINTKTRSKNKKSKQKVNLNAELISENSEIKASSEILTSGISKEKHAEKSIKTLYNHTNINSSEKEHVEDISTSASNKKSADVKSILIKNSCSDLKQIGKMKKTGLSKVLAKPNEHLKKNLIKNFHVTDENNDNYSEVKDTDSVQNNEEKECLTFQDKQILTEKIKRKSLQKPSEVTNKGNISVVQNNANQEKNVDNKLIIKIPKIYSKNLIKKGKNTLKPKKSSTFNDKNTPDSKSLIKKGKNTIKAKKSSTFNDKNTPDSNPNQYDSLSRKEELIDKEAEFSKSESINQNASAISIETTFEITENNCNSASVKQDNQFENISPSSAFEIEKAHEHQQVELCDLERSKEESNNINLLKAGTKLVSYNDTSILSMPVITDNDEEIQLKLDTKQMKRRIEQCDSSSSADECSSNREDAVFNKKRKYFEDKEKFDAYCKLSTLFSSHGLELDNIFRTPKFRSMVEKYRNNPETIVFIGTVKCPLTGKVEPNIRMHKSKKRLIELLASIQAKKD